jgi:hypothetical protein
LSVEATYRGTEYVSHRGDFDPPAVLGEYGLNQDVTFQGVLVPFKDGRVLPLFTDLKTFGKSQMFRFQSEILLFIQNTHLLTCPPFPSPVRPPMEQLYSWAKSLPFKVTAFWDGADNDETDLEYLVLPSEENEVVIEYISWVPGNRGTLVPWVTLDKDVPFQGTTTREICLKSLVNLKTLGLSKGTKSLVFDSWVKPLDGATRTTWPTRCPKCNTPTKEVGFHLVCRKCAELP